NFKAVTSRKIRSEYNDYLRQFYWNWDQGFWSESYSLDSVGFASLDILKKYVENQGRDCLTTLRSVSQLSHTCGEPNRLCDAEFFEYSAGLHKLTVKNRNTRGLWCGCYLNPEFRRYH
ncbi:MAG: transposase, partial [Waterburya sp.]